MFLAYAPAPPAAAKALCLVDSGVNATPDTTPGLVSATALDGGTGADVDPLWHGTINAAIAGGAGQGVLGAWPQLKIVSVRATDIPSPGQKPSFQFDDYTTGIEDCAAKEISGVQIAAIALPLSSVIPPTPDQVQEFAAAVDLAQVKGISILAAAGNEPGPTQLPGSQPGILAVGAGNRGTVPCSFSPTTGLTFFAPGCGLDQIDTAGNAFCCGNGTSQASAFAAGVLVALRSYDPALTAPRAVELLLSTTRNNGQLDATAAFRAAGLGAIVDAGVAATPKPPVPQPLPGAAPLPTPPAAGARRVPRPSVRLVTWRRGVLTIRLKSIPKGARLAREGHVRTPQADEPRHQGAAPARAHPAAQAPAAAPEPSRRVERYRDRQSDPIAPMTRALGKALLLTATTAACLALLCGTAVAGSYYVTACSPSTSPGLWAAVNTYPTSYTTGNNCGGPAGSEVGPLDNSNQGALYAEDILNSAP